MCWQIKLNNVGETAIPYTDLPTQCENLLPQVGITGTPVIDVTVTPPILYVVTSHKISATAYAERLHAIDTTTGLEEPNSPVDIAGALGSNFDIITQNQRPGLALSHPAGNLANVYIAWASNCDQGNYKGWLAGFQLNYSTGVFSSLGSFTSEPAAGRANQGGIWMAGSAPAIDGQGNVYVAVANGTLTPPSQTSGTWGNSVLKLSPGTVQNPPAVLDFYTPNDYSQLDNGGPVCQQSSCNGNTVELANDTDMGTGGVVLLSSSELVSVGKEGMLYAIPYNASSNTSMGGLDGCGYSTSCTSGSDPTAKACSTSGPGSIAQCFEATVFNSGVSTNGIWGAPAFWSAGGSNQYLFGIGLHDRMYWYNYSAPAFNTTNPPQSDHPFNRQNQGGISVGGTASITWNGSSSTTGVTWALDSNGFGRPGAQKGTFQESTQAILYAYPATPNNLTCGGGGYVCELWDTNQSLSTFMPGAVKFTVPTVVDGYILVGGGAPSYFATGGPCDPVNFPSCAGQLTILH
jgi:hypothetical protein